MVAQSEMQLTSFIFPDHFRVSLPPPLCSAVFGAHHSP